MNEQIEHLIRWCKAKTVRARLMLGTLGEGLRPELIRAAKSRGAQIVLPTLPYAWRIDRVEAKRAHAPATNWANALAHANAVQMRDLEVSIPTIYEATQSRFSSMDAKAVGAIQAAAVVAVGTFFALRDSFVPRVLAVLGLIFLASSVIAATRVLLPRQREIVTMQEIGRRGGGLAGMAEIGEETESETLTMSNFVTSALYDLGRAAALTAIALTIVVL